MQSSEFRVNLSFKLLGYKIKDLDVMCEIAERFSSLTI